MSISLPEALKELADQNRWVAWYDDDGRKIPKSVKTGNAKTNDPDTWGTFDQAAKTMDYKRYTGVGVMLGDGLIGIDLDHVIDPDGQIKDWAQKLIDQIGSYTEISPSGTGVHILAKADPKTVGMIGNADHRKGIEIYNHNRYFTLTGNQLNDNPLRDATEQVQQVMREHFPASSADDRVRRQVGAMARSQTRRMANQAMIANAGRDHVRFARVPSGGRTCAFCAMLASRGFVYHTAETAGSMNRYHNDCRCEIVPGFDDDTSIDGYDPDALYEDYARARDEAGDNPSTSDILAAMRRHEGKYTDGMPQRIAPAEGWRQPHDINEDRILSLRKEHDVTDDEWYRRQEAVGVSHSVDTLYPHEIVFLERFLALGNHIEWIPRDKSNATATNDFRWIEQRELCELKSMTKADYGKIGDRITKAVRSAMDNHKVVKDCFVTDLGDTRRKDKLINQLEGYNSREWKIRRLFVLDGDGLIEIKLK